MKRYDKIDRLNIIGLLIVGLLFGVVESAWWLLLIPAGVAYAGLAWWLNGKLEGWR